MPRTFSRGVKFTGATLFDLYQRFLTTEEQKAFEDLAILLICPAPLELPLKEQEILAPVFKIKEELRNIQKHFQGFHGDVLPSTDTGKRFDDIIASVDRLIELVEGSFLVV